MKRIFLTLAAAYAAVWSCGGSDVMNQEIDKAAERGRTMLARIEAKLPPPVSPALAKEPPPPTPPSNNDFTNRVTLPSIRGTALGSNLHASLEDGEPWHNMDGYQTNSIWWSWTAQSTEPYGFDTAGSLTPVTFAIYTGDSLLGLTLVKRFPIDSASASCTIDVVSGTTYQVAIVGSPDSPENMTTFNYYPQTFSDIYVDYTDTSSFCRIIADSDGSVVFAPYDRIETDYLRTNEYGLTVWSDINKRDMTRGITLHNKFGAPVLTGATPPGISAPYIVMDYVKGRLLVYEQYTSRLVLFSISAAGFEQINEQVMTDFAGAMFSGNGIIALQSSNSFLEIISKNYFTGASFYDKNLKQLTWSLPIKPGTLDGILNPKGILCRVEPLAYYTAYTVYSKGGQVYLRSVDHPDSPADGLPAYHFDDTGGMLLWSRNGSSRSYATNTPVSYVGKKGDLRVIDQMLPGIEDSSMVLECNGKYLYVAAPDGTTNIVHIYKLAADQFNYASELPVVNRIGSAAIEANKLSIYSQPGMQLSIAQYDLLGRKQVFEDVGDGYVRHIRKGVFNRVETQSAGDTNIVHCRVFSKKGTISTNEFSYLAL